MPRKSVNSALPWTVPSGSCQGSVREVSETVNVWNKHRNLWKYRLRKRRKRCLSEDLSDGVSENCQNYGLFFGKRSFFFDGYPPGKPPRGAGKMARMGGWTFTSLYTLVSIQAISSVDPPPMSLYCAVAQKPSSSNLEHPSAQSGVCPLIDTTAKA